MSTPSSALFRQASWLYLAVAVGALVWIGLRGGELDLTLLLSSRPELDLAYGLGTGLTMLLAWSLARRTSAAARRLETALVSLLGPLRRDEAVALAFFSAIAEELLFRGAMLPAWGLIASSLVFAVLHAGPSRELLPWALSALVAGFAFGGLALAREGALLAPMLAHFVVNAVQLPRLGALGEASRENDEPLP